MSVSIHLYLALFLSQTGLESFFFATTAATTTTNDVGTATALRWFFYLFIFYFFPMTGTRWLRRRNRWHLLSRNSKDVAPRPFTFFFFWFFVVVFFVCCQRFLSMGRRLVVE